MRKYRYVGSVKFRLADRKTEQANEATITFLPPPAAGTAMPAREASVRLISLHQL